MHEQLQYKSNTITRKITITNLYKPHILLVWLYVIPPHD